MVACERGAGGDSPLVARDPFHGWRSSGSGLLCHRCFRQNRFWRPFSTPCQQGGTQRTTPGLKPPATRDLKVPLISAFSPLVSTAPLCKLSAAVRRAHSRPNIKSTPRRRPLLVLCRPRQPRSRPLHPHHTHRNPRHPRRHFPFHLIHLHRRRPCPLHLRPHAAGHLPYHRRHSGRARPSRLPACSSHLPLCRAR